MRPVLLSSDILICSYTFIYVGYLAFVWWSSCNEWQQSGPITWQWQQHVSSLPHGAFSCKDGPSPQPSGVKSQTNLYLIYLGMPLQNFFLNPLSVSLTLDPLGQPQTPQNCREKQTLQAKTRSWLVVWLGS